ncbi:MAG: multicopper oxidase domain-containing protein [Saprospiraceae bacterium]|nr:multicopper oxidase domain-containing protein [Saprospiraceae bacterium]
MEEGSYYMGLTDSNGNPMYTTAWGYTYNGVKMHLGPTFVTMKNVPIDVRWMNNLNYGHSHLLPIDHTIHLAHPALGIPTVAHLHGGHTEPASDGHPEAWFTKSFTELGPNWQKDIYHYSLDQEGAMLWYHDHALGFTRLNVYAGLAGMWLHRDQNELSLNLPSGAYEREIVVQDKMFSPSGQLFFPSDPGDPLLPNPSILPEFFGDYIMVNGTVWPALDVAPTKYRFRVVNGSDSRVYLFKLSNGASFKQIGTDGGLLNAPVTLTELLLAPGERADLIIDFSAMAGQQVVLQNFGPDGPFQGIDPLTALPLGGAADPATTGQIMMFRVNQPTGTAFNVPNTLRQPIQFLGAAQNTRQVLLFEGTDQYGRILPSLGTVANGQLGWIDPVTETPKVGDVEIWEIYNTTMDAHPIHLHQVVFELIDRQEFMATQDPVTGALSNIVMMGAPIAPASNEKGWKDTAVNYPMHRTRYKVKFDIPGDYVWHCHILSHEDHDMMRPLKVLPATGGGGGGTGTPNCANIHITPVTGGISVTGLDGAPITSLEIFTSSWQPYFSCFGNCGASKVVNVPVGTFYVKAKYFSASYQLICEVNQTITVSTAITSAHSERLEVEAHKYEEHVAVYWTHNMGDMTHAYVLERSLDGNEFEAVEELVSKGGHSTELYNGFDLQPANGDNYYRVKMVRLDGTFRYSEVYLIHYEDVTDYSLFPNPATDFVKLNLETYVGAKDVVIKIYNDLGLQEKEYNLDEVYGKFFQIDVRNFHEGHYIVWLVAPGHRAVAKSLVIAKN